jgi:hypothetical protein
MPKVWNIGNTTVRNPKRIENALQVFLEEGFSGNAKGTEAESRLHGKFKEREVLEFDGEASDWNGRKWRAAFYQLGFVSHEQYKINEETKSVQELFAELELADIINPYQVTPAGQKLIAAAKVPEIEDIYLRQYCCYELPNSLERNFSNGKMKPFILFLEVLNLLQDAGMDGLNKFETGLFIQKFQDHRVDLAKVIFEDVVEFRNKISKCTKSKEIKAVKLAYLEELQKFARIDPNSVVRDYSDTTFRYFSLSGLFTRIGETIVIRPNKRDFVKKLLESEPIFLFTENPVEYFRQFYWNSYQIPTDIKEFALHEVELLKNGIRDKVNPLFRQANKLSAVSDLATIQALRYELIEYNNWEREEEFANEQQTKDAIKDILRYLKVLNDEPVPDSPEIDDRSAFLEWAVWRSFLAIDEIICPIHQTRRFPLDQDFMPRNTAPGGGADLLFEFETYVLVVEVTLTSSHRQMAVESEPVRRHTVQYKDQFPNKDIYCLFIAPSVDNNVVETFRIGVWYKGDEEEFVNIVPMNLSDFIVVIETLTNKKYHNSDFKTLIDRCLVFRNVRAPQWKIYISKEVNVWKERVIAV